MAARNKAQKKQFQADRMSRVVARTIGVFAPNMALKYLSRRAWLAYYTAGSPSGPNQGWTPTNKTADAIMDRDRGRLLSRARDLERNSSHISGAINKITNNVIYGGVKPQSKIKDFNTGKPKKNLNSIVETAWENWAEHDWVDFYDVQELILRHLWVDGEVLIHKFYDSELAARNVCPLGLEVLEADFLVSTRNRVEKNGNHTKAGIEYGKSGRPVAYHIFKEHPGDNLFPGVFSSETRRIPATEIKHIFHKRRASQSRGISWLAAIIMEMRDFSEYQSSERIAARLASAFGVFIESPYPEHQINHPLISETEDPEGMPDINDLPEYLGTGRMDVLPPGMKINVAQYQRPSQTYEPFTKTSLKSASTGTPLSYENFTNDFSEATYSAARQAVLEERRGYRKMQIFINRHFNRWIWNSFLEYASTSGLIGNIGINVPVTWQNPGWPWIDPQKDSKAAQIELKMKTKSRAKIAAERGDDWHEEVEALADEEETLKSMGLTPEEE